MKYVLLLVLIFVSLGYALEGVKPSAKNEQTIVANDGIDFKEWESEFDSSMQKAKARVRKCERSGGGSGQSKNCLFEKFQALDPSYDLVH